LPRILHLPAVPKVSLRVAPAPHSSAAPDKWFSESPRIPHSPALPLLRLRVASNPASAAGPMMTPRSDSNFASSTEAGDESSCPTGSCTFLTGLECILNLDSALHGRTSRPWSAASQSTFASSCQMRNCVSNSLTSAPQIDGNTAVNWWSRGVAIPRPN
jgi:hypothetical protein